MSKKQQFKGLKFNYSINGKGLKSKYKTIKDFLNTEFPKNNNPLSPTLDTEITGIKWNGNTISISNKIHTLDYMSLNQNMTISSENPHIP